MTSPASPSALSCLILPCLSASLFWHFGWCSPFFVGAVLSYKLLLILGSSWLSPSAPLLVPRAALSCFAVLLLVGGLPLPIVPRCLCFFLSLGYRGCFPSFAILALPPLGLASLPWSWSFLSQWSIAFFCLGFLRSFTLAPLPLILVVPLGVFQVLLSPFHLRPWVFPLALGLRSSLLL